VKDRDGGWEGRGREPEVEEVRLCRRSEEERRGASAEGGRERGRSSGERRGLTSCKLL
jgi:hypothetical protein